LWRSNSGHGGRRGLRFGAHGLPGAANPAHRLPPRPRHRRPLRGALPGISDALPRFAGDLPHIRVTNVYYFSKGRIIMLGSNIPVVKLGIIAVSRDCFPIALSTQRRKNIVQAYRGEDLYECPVTVENELDMLKAVEDVKAAGCNALVVFLGNFGPETP